MFFAIREQYGKKSITTNLFYLDLGVEGLKSRAVELWENIVRLETEKYDLEERQKRQGYDVSSSLRLWRVKQ